jgi:hypothetical protein
VSDMHDAIRMPIDVAFVRVLARMHACKHTLQACLQCMCILFWVLGCTTMQIAWHWHGA